MNRKATMVLAVYDYRRMASVFALFVQVDKRKKASKRNKQSKLGKLKKARDPTRKASLSFLLLMPYSLEKLIHKEHL